MQRNLQILKFCMPLSMRKNTSKLLSLDYFLQISDPCFIGRLFFQIFNFFSQNLHFFKIVFSLCYQNAVKKNKMQDLQTMKLRNPLQQP